MKSSNLQIESGNLNDKVVNTPERKGWIVGQFMDSESFYKTDNVEVKWSIRKKGDKKEGKIEGSTAKTLVILVKGKFSVNFPELEQEEILLETGDFVSYDAHEVMHATTALEDSTVIVIRWPSKRR